MTSNDVKTKQITSQALNEHWNQSNWVLGYSKGDLDPLIGYKISQM